MPGIHLYSSNRLENLADAFAGLIQSDPLSPFQKETVIIQSRGMERWLALETASRLNIWANFYCPFPNTFVRNIFRLLFSHIPQISRYDKEHILWRLMNIIPTVRYDSHFSQVDSYIGSGDDLKLYQLSSEIADLFDQYSIFRSVMVLDWEDATKQVPADQVWQSVLWCCLVNNVQQNKPVLENHRARLLHLFEEKILDPAFDAAILPPRISIFGISSLPPYHLRILAGLAHHVDLHFFVMNPCREYWFDIIADRDIVKISRKYALSREKMHLSQGNSLLASMGHLGRDFMAMLQECNFEEHACFEDPGDNTLLSRIQQDVLQLEEYSDTKGQTECGKREIETSDLSISFHSCHSPMREVEILHDLLLEIFNTAGSGGKIEPRDVLVMAPEINDYAPLIKAVFDASPAGQEKIPYSISDQSIRGTSKYIDTFLDILQLPQSRYRSTDVAGILETEPVRNRFGFREQDIAIIIDWIQQTRICWGIDRDHKNNLRLPPYDENTWRAGLDRLLLGYAMAGREQVLFENILPYDHIEGNNTHLLGTFLDFSETLFKLTEMLQQSYTMEEWSTLLLWTKEKLLLANKDNEPEDRILHQLLYRLQELQQETSFTGKVSLKVIRAYLVNCLDERSAATSGGTGFLTGGVTFCSMLPMRAIPFQVICLLGMNDGQYPRSGRKISFDLMARDHKRGDRSKRYDDRYLFLESIISARQRLIISYVGQSIQDGSRRPPSVLVSELMDYIDQGFTHQNCSGEVSAAASEMLTTMHHLQPFHPDYFSTQIKFQQQKLFSYSAENCEAAAALAGTKQENNKVFTSPLPAPPVQLKHIALQDLISFFRHPARYLLVRIIGIAPIEESRVLDTSEQFTLKGLSRYKLENDILEHLMQNRDCNRLYQIKKAAGELPHGQTGKTYFFRMVAELRLFCKTLTELLGVQEEKQQQFSLELGDVTVDGQIGTLGPKGMVQYRYGKLQPKDVIRSWVSHLVLNCLPLSMRPGTTTSTYYAGKDCLYRYSPVSNPLVYLEQLLHLYRQGIAEPLSFFPQTSFIFAEEFHKGKSIKEALIKARTAWEGNAFNRQGEKNDPYNRLCWDNMDLSASAFREQAGMIFLPALCHMEKIK